jgi:hypothetical protein
MLYSKEGVHVARVGLQRNCDQCCTAIKAGHRYRRIETFDKGIVNVYRAHEDCHEVAYEMWTYGSILDDDFVILHESLEPDVNKWLIEEYPAVAKRFSLGVDCAEASTD